MLSIIIPTLDEAPQLEQTLASVRALGNSSELICVDGGSVDATVAIAEAQGAIVRRAPRGRGSQQHAGAAASRGDVLWFLHADTRAPIDALTQIEKALADPRVIGGNFRLVFDGTSGGARFLTALYPRLAWVGLRYGDSGFFVRRSIYQKVGGFRPLPIFEDLDFLRRIRWHGRLRTLSGPLVTSSRRFESKPFLPVFARWIWLQLLYWAGCDPQRLGRMYYPANLVGKDGKAAS